MSPTTRSFRKSCRFAWAGVNFAFSRHPNIRRETALAVAAITLGAILRMTRAEWMILILVIGQVFAAELANTAIEAAVDVATQDLHPGAKIAKDVAAGMVLLTSFIAVVIGGLLFLPKVFAGLF